ncbi:MAG: AIR synthase-related protein [Phycisphaerales bacterium]
MATTQLASTSTDRPTGPVHRIEIRAATADADPRGASVRRTAGAALGIEVPRIETARVYLIAGRFDAEDLTTIAEQLLANPVLERWMIGAAPIAPGAEVIDVHPLPGVMDPAAATVEAAVRDLVGDRPLGVTTGVRYDLHGVHAADADRIARELLATTAIESIHRRPWCPAAFPAPAEPDQAVRRIDIRSLDDEALMELSRRGHLFLDLNEMRAIREHFSAIGREPTDVELETIAQTWSEHCVHKTLKSTITYRHAGGTLEHDLIDWSARPHHDTHPDGSVTIHNLLKATVAAATHELIAEGLDWTLSVFVDNAGVIRFDDEWGVCVKVETHNRPSAIEPYGGAATGIGGCIRDIMGTGLAARPIASTDVFCVASPFGPEQEDRFVPDDAATAAPALSAINPSPIPPGVLHPRRVLTRVIEGVRDYGNRMGIPTVNGCVSFDNRYIGNPLVFAGCVGLIPADLSGHDGSGHARPGDLIVVLGGRTGKDGIHGATFSSGELTHTHSDEFAHAVQIGNAIEQKRTLDAIMRARDFIDPATGARRCLFSAITDCGAGGFSSAIGEMGERIGAEVHLDRAPLKYAGLRYDEIWISESQERMVLGVPRADLEALGEICRAEHVELAVLGEFGRTDADDRPELILRFEEQEVARLPMALLHDGIPMPTRRAAWPAKREEPASAARAAAKAPSASGIASTLTDLLPCLLAHPNIASKRWLVRQYDHEVQGNTIGKPFVGHQSERHGVSGPANSAVIQPIPGRDRAIALGNGLQTRLGHPDVPGSDPYTMALAAIDECIRNLVCSGADPARIAILDNFCWPSCGNEHNLGALVRAAEGCYDAAKLFRTPFISGKDSLNNQFRYRDEHGQERLIEIPPTLLISGIGIVPALSRITTMDAKAPGNTLLLVGPDAVTTLGAQAHAATDALPSMRTGHEHAEPARLIAETIREHAPRTAAAVAALIARGHIAAAHDVSDGGLIAALAEMLIAAYDEDNNTGCGLRLNAQLIAHDPGDALLALLSEDPCRYVLEVRGESVNEARAALIAAQVPHIALGMLTDEPTLTITHAHTQTHTDQSSWPIATLRDAWLGTFADW